MKHLNLDLEKLEQRIAPSIGIGIGVGVGVGVGVEADGDGCTDSGGSSGSCGDSSC